MASIVCQVVTKPEQVSFIWSEGPASFEPYHLTGQYLIMFRKLVEEARNRLGDLVKECLLSEHGRGSEEQVGRVCYELAQTGYKLYQQIFRPGADQERIARDVRTWLDELQAGNEIESLEIVIDPPMFIPWNVVYDRRPDEQAFLAEGHGAEHWQPFWGIRYNLAGGRRVNPLRRKPLWEPPTVLLIVDPHVRDGLPQDQQQRLTEFARSRGISMVESKDQLAAALKSLRPDVTFFMYWFCHARPEALVLGDDEISPTDLLDMLSGDDFDGDRRSGGLAFLNACQTAEAGDAGSFLDALNAFGLSGSVATEQQTVDVFANAFGLDFLEGFLDKGEPIGKLLQKLRSRVPLGLLYATYCPPHIRVRRPAGVPAEPASSIAIMDTIHIAGRVLGATATTAREWPPLPDTPYRSLAYYDRQHRALFAGRDDDVHRFAEVLDDHGTRILVLHGESGVGKSSFLRAGVIPYLEEECIGYQVLRSRSETETQAPERERPVLFVRATNDPVRQIAQALYDYCLQPYTYRKPTGGSVEVDLDALLVEFLEKSSNPGALNAAVRADRPLLRDDRGHLLLNVGLSAALQADPSLLGRLLTAIADRLPYALVLVVDQCEEMFTLARTQADAQSRRLALEMLRRVVGTSGDFKVILALRTEYYGRLIDGLRRGLRDVGGVREYLLTDFDEDTLVEAIRRPTSEAEIPYASEVPYKKYRFRYAEGIPKKIAQTALSSATSRYDSVLPLVQVICTQLYEIARQRTDAVIRAEDLELIGGIQGGMRTHVEASLGRLLPQSSDQKAFKRLFTRLYLRQPDGNLTTALLSEDELRRHWTGRMPFAEMFRAAEQGEFRLLRVNLLRIGDQEERRYVSLGHDALAKVAAEWDEELSRGARLRKWLGITAGALALVIVMAGLTVWAWTSEIKARHHQSEAEEKTKQAIEAEIQSRQRFYNLYLAQINLAHRAWEEGDVQLMLKLLEGLKPRPGHENVRGFEWYYLWRLSHNDLATFKLWDVNAGDAGPSLQEQGQTEAIHALAFVDEKTLRTVSSSGIVKQWDANTGTKYDLLKLPKDAIDLLGISSPTFTGDRLALIDRENVVRLWELDAGDGKSVRERSSLRLNPRSNRSGYIRSLAVSPDGKAVAVASTGRESASVERGDEDEVGSTRKLQGVGSRYGICFRWQEAGHGICFSWQKSALGELSGREAMGHHQTYQPQGTGSTQRQRGIPRRDLFPGVRPRWQKISLRNRGSRQSDEGWRGKAVGFGGPKGCSHLQGAHGLDPFRCI